MIEEHALAVHENISLEDLNYLIKKANRLGLSSREIARVYEYKEGDTRHIYFEAEGWEMIQQRRIS